LSYAILNYPQTIHHKHDMKILSTKPHQIVGITYSLDQPMIRNGVF